MGFQGNGERKVYFVPLGKKKERNPTGRGVSTVLLHSPVLESRGKDLFSDGGRVGRRREAPWHLTLEDGAS